jgi:phosphoenolpyruvate---glycerone phosphotransferase subunit DhaL
MGASFTNAAGAKIVLELIAAIQAQKQHLSDIDGLIGDGDHGVNMNKGFTLAEEQLAREPGNLTHSLSVLSKILMMRIGGSMGPLYGMFFKAMAGVTQGAETIDAVTFGKMLRATREAIEKISPAKPRDKTLMDALVPADEAFEGALAAGQPFGACLDAMSQAAEQGRDATKDMVAKLGRSSRLGERSRGVVDAGAASCCLILQTTAKSIKGLLQ